MAVLVEALSVIVRRDRIEEKYPGGWTAFKKSIPNATFCADDEIATVAFMSPNDVQAYVNRLEQKGLVFLSHAGPVDIAVVDMFKGPAPPCAWLEFTRMNFGEEGKVAVCWFSDLPVGGVGFGIYIDASKMNLATPAAWEYAGSLSQKTGYVPPEEIGKQLKYLRTENGIDVYLDSKSGREVYTGRASAADDTEH